MLRRLLLGVALLALAGGATSAADLRAVTDSAGRRVEVPARVERVYPAGVPAAIFLYTLAPEKMLGWMRALGPEERAFVPARFAEPPTLGRLTGRGDTAKRRSGAGRTLSRPVPRGPRAGDARVLRALLPPGAHRGAARLREVYGVEVMVTEAARPDGHIARVCVPALGADRA